MKKCETRLDAPSAFSAHNKEKHHNLTFRNAMQR